MSLPHVCLYVCSCVHGTAEPLDGMPELPDTQTSQQTAVNATHLSKWCSLNAPGTGEPLRENSISSLPVIKFKPIQSSQKRSVNLAKQDPGMVGQKWYARAGTNFLQPRTSHFGDLCICFQVLCAIAFMIYSRRGCVRIFGTI